MYGRVSYGMTAMHEKWYLENQTSSPRGGILSECGPSLIGKESMLAR
jgi:hypothetical protein